MAEPTTAIYQVSLIGSGVVSMVRARSAEEARTKFLFNQFEVSSRPATEEEIQNYQDNGGRVW